MSYYPQDENERPVQGTESYKVRKNAFEIAMQKRDEKFRIEALKFAKRFHADIDLKEYKKAEFNK